MRRLLDESIRMIKLSSVTERGNEELANYVHGLMVERGFKSQLQLVTHASDEWSKRQFNAIGILGDPLVDRKTRKGLLLTSHLDTLTPGIPESWTETGGKPLEATVKGDRIYGLGAADAKLDFLCKIHALAKFREKKLRMPVYLVGTCGSQEGMFGAKYLIKAGTLNPKFVIVGGATDLRVSYAHKSMHQFRVSIGFQQIHRDARGFNRGIELHSFGRAAGGAFPALGVNAIEQALEFLRVAAESGFEIRYTQFEGGAACSQVPDRAKVGFYLSSHQFEDFKRFFRELVRSVEGNDKRFRIDLGGVGDTGVRFLPDPVFACMTEVVAFFQGIAADFKKVQDPAYEVPHSTVSFGKLHQGMSSLELGMDLRLLPELQPEEIQRHIQQGIQAIAGHYPGLNVAVTRERVNPPLTMTPEHELVKICRDSLEDADLEPQADKASQVSEAAHFFQAGYESVVFGPGVAQGNAQGPNENCSLDQLEQAVRVYEKIIERVCM